MIRKPLRTLTAATSLALAACAHSSPLLDGASMTNASGKTVTDRQPVKEWPLRFDSHKFSVFTYDTSGARVVYAGQLQIDQDDDELKRSSASYGPDYQRSWSGIHGMIRNFPAPAKVSWRSKDGQTHEAEIDFGEIFKDERVRHNVPRDEVADMANGEYRHEPSIILEINDRTIRVYMRAFIPTKDFQIPGNPYSDARDEVVLVETYTY